jgi:hypothetical protein
VDQELDQVSRIDYALMRLENARHFESLGGIVSFAKAQSDPFGEIAKTHLRGKCQLKPDADVMRPQ